MSEQLNSGRQQRAITPTVTTASFKPLSLDEIMLVPLAKQKAEDQMIMDMDELDLMATNSLEADQGYVNAQRDAFKNEVGSVRDRLMTEGVDRSLINKFKGLRSRKNLEFSVNGNTGKANAAYNAMQLNKKNIMNNPRLSSEQKRLGMLEAESAYNRSGGVGAGAEYIDYIGNDEVDIQGESQKIAAQMTPQTIAEAKGYTFDGKTYKDSNGKDVILTPEHIQNVAYQTMKGNNKTMAYLEEAERLGIIDSADDELRRAAINAGNIYQRNDSTISTNAQVGDIGKGNVNGASQNWTGVDLSNSMEGLYDRKTDFDETRIPDFFDAKGNVMDATPGYDPVENERRKNAYEAYTGSYAGRMKPVNWEDPDSSRQFGNWQLENYGNVYDYDNQYRLDTKKKIADLRSTYPDLTTQLKPAVMSEDGLTELEPARQYNDQEIYNAFTKGRQKASVQFSQAIMPLNVDNTFNNYATSLIGTKEAPGSFASMTLSVNGSEPAGLDATAKGLGMDPEELRQAVATSGRVIGFLPGHTSMPGAYAIQFTDPKDPDKTRILSVKGNNKSEDIFRTVSKMNNQVIKGIPHSKQVVINGNGTRINQHITTSMDPSTGSMESYTINTVGDYTKDQVLSFEFLDQEGRPGVQAAYKNGVKVVPVLVRRGYDYSVNKAQRETSTMYDNTLTKNTTK
jgi:hypothetical protein